MKYIKAFSQIGIRDIALVGGKNAALGEMLSGLSRTGLKIPDGFAITADAYRYHLEVNGLVPQITDALSGIDERNTPMVAMVGSKIRNFIMHANLPKEIIAEISVAYREFCAQHGANTPVAVRGSTTAVDVPGVSFSGQQESYMNIYGVENLINASKRTFASMYTDRAIVYRMARGISHTDAALSIGVQKMVRSDQGASGTLYTLETESGFRDVVYICASHGLGESITQGKVDPDEYYVSKVVVTPNTRPIISKYLGGKHTKTIFAADGAAGISTRTIATTGEERDRFALLDDDIFKLARCGMVIEKYFTNKFQRDMAMDIEWAKDGLSGELFIVQARPEATGAPRAEANELPHYQLAAEASMLCTGRRVGQGVVSGTARVITDPSRMHELKQGEILVTDSTDADWEPALQMAAGVITNHGGRNCHAAIFARKMAIPGVIGAGDATQHIKSGGVITLLCTAGGTGSVHTGKLTATTTTDDLSALPQPDTHIMLNLSHPDQAFELSRLPVDGVGLVRLEHIISDTIRVHPRAILEYDTLEPALQDLIKPLTRGYSNPQEFFIQRLAEGIATIAAAFFPRPVIVRLSDFKSSEYACLIGGSQFEPEEKNPVLGWRGAGRYHTEDFLRCFIMECTALRLVRETMGLNNVAILMPFARTVQEACKVLDIMATQSLVRGEKGLQIFLMCETPANVMLADQFLEHFDGFSIGSNDLTQLTLGVDQDSDLLADFDARDLSVMKLMELAIHACNKRNKYIGICGDAPSKYAEITRWLVQQGIKSISLNPDAAVSMIKTIAQTEQTLGKRS